MIHTISINHPVNNFLNIFLILLPVMKVKVNRNLKGFCRTSKWHESINNKKKNVKNVGKVLKNTVIN